MMGRSTCASAMARRALAAASLLLLASTPALAQQLVTNGGFETGDFAGWTEGGNTSYTAVARSCPSLLPVEGNFCAIFGPVGGNGMMSQTISTHPGDALIFSFFLSNDGFTPNNFAASFNGTDLFNGINMPAQDFTQYTYSVTATGNDQIGFTFRNDPSYFGLDNVSLTVAQQSTVPEPSSLALLGTGLVGLVPMVRRRRRK